MFHKKQYFYLAFILTAAVFIILVAGCSENSSTNTPSDDHTYLSLAFPPDSTFLDVAQLLVRVTGPDIPTPVTATHEIDHDQSYAIIDMAVPAGANRRFVVYGTDANGDSLYWAVVTLAIASGKRNDAAAFLIPINQGVHIYIPYPVDPLFDQVNEMKVTITGDSIVSPLISTQAVNHDQTSLVFDLSVPAGRNRHFEIVGINPFDKYLYRALSTTTVSDSQSTNITVTLTQLGYGATSRVRIFRNMLPWGLADLDSLLTSMNFTQGAGDNQYQVFNSTLMGSILLIPGRDLVIFEGWQDTAFYNDYMAAREYFEEFIDSGGNVLMMANEGGTHSWFYDSTNMHFPGGVTFINGSTNFNRLVTPDHNIVAGMADSLTGGQVSHGGLGTLPPGAIVLMNDSQGRSTLVAYTFGRGVVVMSTHPLENLYNHRATYNSGSLLARIVRFMLGMDPTPNAKSRGD